MQCEDLADQLAEVAAGRLMLDLPSRRHVERCPECRGELIQYRTLLRTLRQLRTEVLEPMPGLLPDILAAIEEAGERSAIRNLLQGRRLAYAGGFAAAAVAGVAGVVALSGRSRRDAVMVSS